jgi:hypothetical protein
MIRSLGEAGRGGAGRGGTRRGEAGRGGAGGAGGRREEGSVRRSRRLCDYGGHRNLGAPCVACGGNRVPVCLFVHGVCCLLHDVMACCPLILPVACRLSVARVVWCLHSIVSAEVIDFQFSPFDDSLLATSSADCTVKLWQVHISQCRAVARAWPAALAA